MPEQIIPSADEAIKYLCKKIEKQYNDHKIATEGLSTDFCYEFNCKPPHENIPPLKCRIVRYYEPYLMLLKTPYNYSCEDDETEEDTITFYKNSPSGDLKDILKKVYELPHKYYYSKILDCFLRNDQKELEREEIAKKIVGNSDEKCCVCYDYTKIKTKCNHYLCRECAHKSFKICKCDECDDCDESTLELICPMCREFLTHHFV